MKVNALTKISQKIEGAAEITGILIEPVSPEKSEAVWQAIVEKFAREARAKSGLGRPEVLWERLINTVSIQNMNAWVGLDDFIKDKDVLLFFNRRKEKAMYRIAAGTNLSTLLGETYPFEFYLTDDRTRFLVCFNHHDYLIAVGSAKDWFSRLKDQRPN